MARHFWAIEHRYGANMRDRDGRPIAEALYAFDTAAGRTAWLAVGPAYTDARGYREAVAATSPLVRSELRRTRQGDGWIVWHAEAYLAEQARQAAEEEAAILADLEATGATILAEAMR